jgi:hypothetical protein
MRRRAEAAARRAAEVELAEDEDDDFEVDD